jgi:hypothetical protein
MLPQGWHTKVSRAGKNYYWHESDPEKTKTWIRPSILSKTLLDFCKTAILKFWLLPFELTILEIGEEKSVLSNAFTTPANLTKISTKFGGFFVHDAQCLQYLRKISLPNARVVFISKETSDYTGWIVEGCKPLPDILKLWGYQEFISADLIQTRDELYALKKTFVGHESWDARHWHNAAQHNVTFLRLSPEGLHAP